MTGIQTYFRSTRKIRILLFLTGAFFILLFRCSLRADAASSVNVVTTAKKSDKGTWITRSGGKSYRYSNQKLARNVWLKIDGKIYRFNSSGFVETGLFCWNGQTYYANAGGAIYISRWHTGLSGKRAYYQADGTRAKKKWLKLNGNLYYIDENGFMATSRAVGSYYIGADGKMVRDCVANGYYYNEKGLKTVAVFEGDYIFVGDSRMYFMEQHLPSTTSSTKYISKRGGRYSWYSTTGEVQLRYYLKANPKVTVVLAMGINDMWDIAEYCEAYQKLMEDFPDTAFYVLSVNPVVEEKTILFANSISDAQIRAFNQQLKSAFPSCFIDSYSYLNRIGFQTEDGAHYLTATDRKLYRYIVAKIKSGNIG